MGTNLTIANLEPFTTGDVTPVKNPRRKSATETDALSQSPDPAFGMMMNQEIAFAVRNEAKPRQQEECRKCEEKAAAAKTPRPPLSKERMEQVRTDAPAVPDQEEKKADRPADTAPSEPAPAKTDDGDDDRKTSGDDGADLVPALDVPTGKPCATGDQAAPDDLEAFSLLKETTDNDVTALSLADEAAPTTAEERKIEVSPEKTGQSAAVPSATDELTPVPSAQKEDGDEAASPPPPVAVHETHPENEHDGLSDDESVSDDRRAENDTNSLRLTEDRDEENNADSEAQPEAPSAAQTMGRHEPVDRATTSAASADFQAVLRNEPQAAAGALPSTGGNAHIRSQAADPAEPFEHAVSIVKDGNRLAVQMEHEGLGKLDIDLRMNKGLVQALFQVADTAAKEVIENNMQRIINTLLGEGLSVGGFSVALKERHDNGYETAEDARENGQAMKSHATQKIDAQIASAKRGLVNIFA